MLLYNLIHANNDDTQPLYHDLINRLVDYDIDTDLSSSMVGYSVDGLMLGAFENMRITSNIYGNTPITAKALDYIQIDNGIIDPSNGGSITVETGKITCGNDFTSSNTPYSRAENNSCQTCSLEEQLGTLLIPESSGKSKSNKLEMLELDQYNLLDIDETNESKITLFPNPTSDFFVIPESFQEMILLDQNGAEVKRFDSSKQLFDIHELSSGMYTLIVKLTDYETLYLKLVKI